MRHFKSLKKVFAMILFLCAAWVIFSWTTTGILSLETLDPRSVPINVKNKLCHVNMIDERPHLNNSSDLKMIYYITPTYPRPEQVPEMIRLSHTLMHVPRLHWIVADDQRICSDLVLNVLRRTGLPYTHISSPKPFRYRINNFPRGVSNRRAALSWLRENVLDGVLYFGDDDNTVDLQLFDEIRNTKKVSMFPVGLIGDFGVSSPVVRDGKVIGFFDSWPGSRTFPVDMAGFAVNIEFLKSTTNMPYLVGHEEDKFLISLNLKMNEIEPLADNCTKVLVWHTKTQKHKKTTLRIDINHLDSNTKTKVFANLLREVSHLGMVDIDMNGGNVKPFITRDKKTHKISKTLNEFP